MSIIRKGINIVLIALLLATFGFVAMPGKEVEAAVFSVRTVGQTNDVGVNWDNVAVDWEYQDDIQVLAGYYNNTLDATGAGMRFQAVTIPQGSLITTATITFTAKTSYAEVVVNTRFTGEDVDDAATFSGIADYQARRGTVVAGANDDYITDAQIDWDGIAGWTIDLTYVSPELKTIVQEIVDREGWVSGNDLVIWWDDHADRSDNEAFHLRDAYSWDNVPAKAPQISITYGTTSNLADVISLEATSIEATTADLNGYILDLNGGGDVTTRGFVWGTEWGTYGTTVQEGGAFGTGAYSLPVAGLPAGTRIYYRAFASNANGTMYGVPLLYYNTTGVAAYTIDLATTQEADYTDYEAHDFNPVISISGAETNLMTPMPIIIGDTIYMYYTAAVGGFYQINYATSADGGINYTKQGTSLEKSGSGWDDSGVGYATVFDTEIVGTHRYAMLYSAYDGANWPGIGYAYSADGITWTRGSANPVVPLGAGGSWDDYDIITTSNIIQVGNTYYMHYGGKADAVLHWREGLVTWEDFEGVYTKHAGNPVLSYTPTEYQALLAQTGIGTTTVTIGDTSVFEANMPVWVRDNVAGVNDEWNRVASITDATHLELTNNADRNYPIGSTIRSTTYGANSPQSTLAYNYADTTWILLNTATLPYTPLGAVRETTSYYTSDDGVTWIPDYANSPPVPFDWDGGVNSAENPRVLLDAQVSQFTTLVSADPVVLTGDATGVGQTGATLQGSVFSLGGETTVYCFFQYGETAEYGTNTAEQTKTAVGGFNQAISGLDVNKLYHFRAALRFGVANYVYGADYTFITTEAMEVMSLNGGGVFDDFIVEGDLLFTVDVTNEYSPYYPNDDSTAYFDIILYETDGITVIAAAPLVDWGRRPQAIYLSPDMATPITRGDPYILKVKASFSDAVVSAYTLESNDWYGDNFEYLDRWCIRVAHLMELHTQETLVTYVSGKGEVLNVMGGVEFDRGIPGLTEVRPGLFEVVTHYPQYIAPTYTDAYEGATDWELNVGANVVTTMDTLGDIVDVDGKVIFQWLLTAAVLVLAFATGSFLFGLMMASPVAMWGWTVGIIDIPVLAIIGTLLIFLIAYKMWWSKA